MLPQAQMTLNMLRASNMNKQMSAHETIFGKYDFNKTPIAPPGTKSIIYVTSNLRKTFDPRGKLCWYIVPSLQHYRCMKFFIPNGGERISDTSMLYPANLTTPHWTKLDAILQAALDLTTALKNPTTEDSPYTKILKAQQDALEQLANIFKTNFEPTRTNPPHKTLHSALLPQPPIRRVLSNNQENTNNQPEEENEPQPRVANLLACQSQPRVQNSEYSSTEKIHPVTIQQYENQMLRKSALQQNKQKQ